ncbi:MAG: flagellar hook-length control protein FliK [Candidatus Thiodiazotropha sp.]
MQIPIAKILQPPPLAITAKSLLQTMKPGQILQGTALSENINGTLSLQIGVTRLKAQTTLSVSPGQSLILQVEKAGELPELKVLTMPSLKQLMASALKSNLPRQQPLSQLFKALTQLIAKPSPQTQQLLPMPVKQAIEQLISGTLSCNNPNFKTELTHTLQISGTQTESQLMYRTVNNNDLKLNLLRLIGLVKPYLSQQGTLRQSDVLPQATPNLPVTSAALPQASTSPLPETTPQIPQPPQTWDMDATTKLLLDLFKHLDSAIARIQTNQLSSLPTEDPLRQVWQFELPIRNGNGFDLFHIRISQEANRKKTNGNPGWRLTLHMNIQPLGPMKVSLHLMGESLSTIIWSEKPDTSQLVKQNLNRLREGFKSAGLEISKLEAFQGSVKNEYELPIEHSLLNEKV